MIDEGDANCMTIICITNSGSRAKSKQLGNGSTGPMPENLSCDHHPPFNAALLRRPPSPTELYGCSSNRFGINHEAPTVSATGGEYRSFTHGLAIDRWIASFNLTASSVSFVRSPVSAMIR